MSQEQLHIKKSQLELIDRIPVEVLAIKLLTSYFANATQDEVKLNQQLFADTIPGLRNASQHDHSFKYTAFGGEQYQIKIPGGMQNFFTNFFVCPERQPFKNVSDILESLSEEYGITQDEVKEQIANKRITRRYLDMCTGTGIGAVSAGKAVPGICISICDINPNSVATAVSNLESNDVRFEGAYTSDLYRDIPDEEKFDYISANVPFRFANKANDHIEGCIADFDADLAARLFYESRDRLKEGGSLYIVMSKVGSSHLVDLATLFGFKNKILEEQESNMHLGVQSDKTYTFIYYKFTLNKELSNINGEDFNEALEESKSNILSK
ncbi:MAG: methyltransferase [bacterium]